MEIIGYCSGILLALCGLPEAIKSYRTKRCDIGWGMLSIWLVGEVGLTIYELNTLAVPRLVNYGLNIVFVSIMMYYKLRRD